jgi:CheY-like chemotaxis protein
MTDTRYCLCCDEQVPFGSVERNMRREITCNYCGFTLDIEKPAETRPADEKGYTLVADDSKYTRKIIEDLIIEKKFSSDVMSFENGLELTTAYSKVIAEGKQVDVAIIDLNMPVMNGLTAARTLRTIEVQQKTPSVPIVFFSAEKADEELRTQMESLEPAFYVNKGSDPDPDKLAGRVEYLLWYLKDKFGH